MEHKEDLAEVTISRKNPLSEAARAQAVQNAQFSQIGENGGQSPRLTSSNSVSSVDVKSPKLKGSESFLDKIVLKFTTISEGCNEAPSFCITTNGARIGSDPCNEVYVPSDIRLATEAHAKIEYINGSFYINDGGYDYSASIRIGVGTAHKSLWYLDIGARFSAGNSVFSCESIDPKSGNLVLKVIEGPLKNEIKIITRAGATFGRSSDNGFCIPDRELSRRHSRIEFDQKSNKYIVYDVGSTNGTYMQLVGPYGGLFKLSLNDHILVGRTGFSINRYDYGLSEEIGHRPTMEDACLIVQHLNISPLCISNFAPQSLFGVFDGHGGSQASQYLSQNLHINIADGLLMNSIEILKIADHVPKNVFHNTNESHDSLQLLDNAIIKCLRSSFLKTDRDFLNSSENVQHGSTATTALILGQRIYAANVGDSRVLLCRNFSPYPLTVDHKPSREDETKRIRDAGGFVINNRVMGELAVSRAFGDIEFKRGIQVKTRKLIYFHLYLYSTCSPLLNKILLQELNYEKGLK